jgi:predicted component of type VI protein secretion system
MNLSLVVIQGKAEGREIPVRLAQFLIGRDPECQLRPASPLVSKRHCAILIRDEKVYIRDFESTNGTLVNQQPIKGETELKDGDALKIGPLNFKVRIAEESATATVPEAPAAAAIAEKTAIEPIKAAVKKGSGFDEESLIDMLLNEGGAAQPVSPNDPVPTGSTIMEGVSIEAAAQAADDKDKKPDAKKEKQKIDPASTANAAKAILDKYMRRPRT